jgi:hypothetical protein
MNITNHRSWRGLPPEEDGGSADEAIEFQDTRADYGEESRVRGGMAAMPARPLPVVHR